jgi:hypothetical protein
MHASLDIWAAPQMGARRSTCALVEEQGDVCFGQQPRALPPGAAVFLLLIQLFWSLPLPGFLHHAGFKEGQRSANACFLLHTHAICC